MWLMSQTHNFLHTHIFLCLPVPSFSFLKQCATIQADICLHKSLLLRNFAVSVDLRHKYLKEGPLTLSSIMAHYLINKMH
jgi:subtilisin-like proprotein convertase family protein